MPFGTRIEGDGVHFRLWAPSAAKVELLLERHAGGDRVPTSLVMERAESGWFESSTKLARPGTLYRFRIDGAHRVPDPASRYQPADVHGPSQVVDPEAFDWTDGGWTGRDWSETVKYELHVGAFTEAGSFDGVRSRLDHLAGIGITAIELMPVADFPGQRNWGYDGVLPFAPDASYGDPGALKRLVQEAHARELMVLLDVVYNHFGPDGNYLHHYAKPFFNSHHRTPWGDAINLDGQQAGTVRDFFIHNALYWLEEFHMDGLRIDAVHAFRDESEPSFLDDLARAVRKGAGRHRRIHLVLENVKNESRLLSRDDAGKPQLYTAQWNDDVHHALHCLLTGESDGYYEDFAAHAPRHLARALAEGFAYQGEQSVFRGRPRGEPSAHLPPATFVNFLQNHDQVGNRAFGERLVNLTGEAPLRAAVTILLLCPATPMLFMGEEWGAQHPFPFFCDFGPDLARSVTAGRRREFARFARFQDPASREGIPDPNAEQTFRSAVLDWSCPELPAHRRWLELYRALLRIRHETLGPWLRRAGRGEGTYRELGGRAFEVRWVLGGGAILSLLANLDADSCCGVEHPSGEDLFAVAADGGVALVDGRLSPWSAALFLDTP